MIGSILYKPPCIVCGHASRFKFKKNEFDIFQCSKCKLGFVYPIPSIQFLQSFYNNKYYESDTNFGYHSSSYVLLENGLKKTYRRFLNNIPKRSYNNILDIGCAYAYFSDVANEILKPKKLVCLDISKEAENAAKIKGYTFIKGFVEDINVKKGCFDLIFMGDCFEHFHNPVMVIKKLSEILATDGIIIVTTVNFNSIFSKLFGINWRLLSPPEHLFYWTPNSLIKLFEINKIKGEISNYWLYYPKVYVLERFREQFKFSVPLLPLLPVKEIPIWSFDVMLGVFRKYS